jgi:hypothetical protein
VILAAGTPKCSFSTVPDPDQSTVTAAARRSHAEVRIRRARVLDQYSGSPMPRYTKGVELLIDANAIAGKELEP